MLGNITSVKDKDGTLIASYTYDTQNQLLTASLPEFDVSYSYTYDSYGNIRSVTSTPTSGGAATTKTYSYSDASWVDLLTSYNGSSITYDQIGNPTQYYDGAQMTWAHGRQMSSYTKGGVQTTYSYNADGIRNRKVSDGIVHDYVLKGSRILAEMIYDPDNIETGYTGDILSFSYNEAGTPVSLKYNGVMYYYVTNQQGDVVSIYNASGTKVGSYGYDAYGKVISISGEIAQLNPIRYRGYYFDTESGLYYLNSRYYDADTGRFINADNTYTQALIPNKLPNKNLFTYCNNSPIAYADYDGLSTHAITFNYNFTLIFGYSFSFGYCWDNNGDSSWIYSYSTPTEMDKKGIQNFGLINIGFSTAYQYTTASSIRDLEGIGWSSGISIGNVGGELIGTSVNNETPNGFQISYGEGIGAVYFIQSMTRLIADSNIPTLPSNAARYRYAPSTKAKNFGTSSSKLKTYIRK